MIKALYYKISNYFKRQKLIKRYKNKLPIKITFGKGAEISNSEFGEESLIGDYASVRNSQIGRLSFIGRYTKITHTKIGSFCAISWDVTINAISHPYSHLTVNAFPYVPYAGNFVKERIQESSFVTINNDVWIGANSVIMPGVVIGNGAVIGAGSVVTKNVPDYAIAVGVPARVIKYRFDDEIIIKLLKIKWWEFPKELIKDNIKLFQGNFDKEKLQKLEELCNS